MNTQQPKDTATRRDFLRTTGALGAGLYLSGARRATAQTGAVEALAMNGGPKAVTHAAGTSTKWPLYGAEEIERITALIQDPNYGPIEIFENAWKEFHGCAYAKAHCNGTSALTSMLFALELPPGSEVLVPDFSTWFPVVPMRFFDLAPVFVDSNPRSMNIDLEDCKRKLTDKTRAIMPVHWFGVPCDMDDICAFADEHGLVVVEDASHAHGARVKDTLIGNWGRMAGFSFQATKPLPAIEGGICMYKEQGDYERATTYGHYLLPNTFPEDSPYRKYQGTAFGSKLRMHPVSAILADVQLRDLNERNQQGTAQMQRLNDRITQLPGLSEQYARPDMQRVYYNNNLMLIDEAECGFSREAAVAALRAEGVDVSAFTWTLLHTYPIFSETRWWRHMPVLPDAVPGCDEINQKAIRLPYWTSDQPELVEQYAAAFEKVWAHGASLA